MLGDISSVFNIYIITGYTDIRKSIDRLCTIVLEQLKMESDGYSLYLFCGKGCDRIKVLLRELDGLSDTRYLGVSVMLNLISFLLFKLSVISGSRIS